MSHYDPSKVTSVRDHCLRQWNEFKIMQENYFTNNRNFYILFKFACYLTCELLIEIKHVNIVKMVGHFRQKVKGTEGKSKKLLKNHISRI